METLGQNNSGVILVQMRENTDQNNSKYGHIVLFGEWYIAEDWAQIWLEVLGVKIKVFRDFMQLNELQYLEPAFKSWPLFKLTLFRKKYIQCSRTLNYFSWEVAATVTARVIIIDF